MSAHRPSPPPAIAGFEHLGPLGSGGFADVFLYQQALPRRKVAVKVLRTGLSTGGEREVFEAEANLMASLSTHPSIVTIYQADIAADGRPYLAMEYCPNPNLAVRLRQGPLPIADALRIGVQVSGAVETVHRAGILHRDIKPANVLVTEYGRPALTDFGIAGTLVGEAAETGGLSIPWSPPEAFGSEISNDVALDVWALGATVYSLLVGRSPFELPGRGLDSLALIDRICTTPLPPLERADAPASLHRVLATSMAKSPRDRFRTALEFGRALQKVQVELSLAVTTADVLDDALPLERIEEEDDGNTRIRGVVSIDPAPRPTFIADVPRATAATRPGLAPVGPGDLERTVLRGSATAGAVAAAPRVTAPALGADPQPLPVERAAPVRPRRRGPLVVGVLGLAAAAAVAGGVVLVSGMPTSTADPRRSAPAEAPADPVGTTSVPAVVDLVGTSSAGSAAFTWTNPEPQDGDSYLWGVVTAGVDTSLVPTQESTVTVPADPSGRTCIEVTLRRALGRASEATIGCTP